MSGFGTNTGEMAAVASAINGLAEPVAELEGKLTASSVTSGDFGRANSSSASGYQTGLQNLAHWVDAHVQAMRGFAGKVEQSAGGYKWSDDSAADGVNKAGG
ncbi:MAG: hypothetical protein JOZ47_00370 [Kutzneria sp.]|nr:hypothetical protein [Kutzneria sp.]